MVDEPTIDASSINAGDRAARLDIEEKSREEDNIPDDVETDGLAFGEENEEQIDITAVDEPEDDAPADIDSFDQESGPDDSVEYADEMVDEPTIDASSINAGDRAARLDIEEGSGEEDNIPDAVETDGLAFGEENEEQIDITAVDEPEDDAPADIDSFD